MNIVLWCSFALHPFFICSIKEETKQIESLLEFFFAIIFHTTKVFLCLYLLMWILWENFLGSLSRSGYITVCDREHNRYWRSSVRIFCYGKNYELFVLKNWNSEKWNKFWHFDKCWQLLKSRTTGFSSYSWNIVALY